MKYARVSLLAVITLLLILGLPGVRGTAAQSSPGNITIFADQNASVCSITDLAPGLITVHVVHTNFSGMAISDFRVSESVGFLGTYLDEAIEVGGHVGDFRGGINLAYGVCLDGPLLLGRISYQGHGTSETCSYLEVVAWRYPWPETQDCNFRDYPAPQLGRLYVNAEAAACQPWCSVATMPSTWGRVKALYRN